MKQYFSSPPLLKQSKHGDTLYVYLAIAPHVISTVLVKKEGATQALVYYASRALRDAKARYQRMEMLAFALVSAARRLCPYFQAYPMKVLIEHPLGRILKKLDSSSRLVSWSVELSEFDIEYISRSVVKGQALVDFFS